MKPLFFGVSVLAFVSSGCMTSPDNPTPAPLKQAILLTEEGRAAFESNDFENAEFKYASALEIHRTIDNPSGIIRNLVNLATVQREGGRSSSVRSTLAALDRYVSIYRESNPDETESPAISNLISEAEWLRARLSMDESKWTEARSELDTAFRLAANRRSPRLLNLHARLCIQEVDFQSAKQATIQSWSISRNDGDAAESARLRARSEEALGNAPLAIQWFGKALKLDQKLARSRSVTDDLLGLARAHRQVGDTSRSKAYASRALQAAQAAQDPLRAKEANALLMN